MAHALTAQPADAGSDGFRVVAFIEVDAALHDDDLAAAEGAEKEATGVAFDRRGGKSGFGEADGLCDGNAIRQRAEA